MMEPNRVSPMLSLLHMLAPLRRLTYLHRGFSTAASPTASHVVNIPYQELIDAKSNLNDKLIEGYGATGLGVLVISGIPQYAEARKKLLPLAHTLAHLPEDVKASLEDSKSLWNAGWSHGKEKLGDTPDTAKGSFYANPCFDDVMSSVSGANARLKLQKEMDKYPIFYPKNIWPSKAIPSLEPNFKTLGNIMYQCTVHLSRHIDKVTKKYVPSYEENLLWQQLYDTKKIKGRLLYYYPVTESRGDKTRGVDDSWIGWHNDSGFLTALTSDIYYNDDTGEEVPCYDPDAGLWIIDRRSGAVKVNIPKDSLAIQCGECLQIVSGGLMVATPHCVQPTRSDRIKVGRATFPVFTDTNASFALCPPNGIPRSQVFDKTPSSKVPPLDQRWVRDGTPFIEFLADTFAKYYEHATKK